MSLKPYDPKLKAAIDDALDTCEEITDALKAGAESRRSVDINLGGMHRRANETRCIAEHNARCLERERERRRRAGLSDDSWPPLPPAA